MIVYCVLIIVIKHHMIFVSKQNTGIVFFYFEFFIFWHHHTLFSTLFPTLSCGRSFRIKFWGATFIFPELFCLAFFVNLTAILL